MNPKPEQTITRDRGRHAVAGGCEEPAWREGAPLNPLPSREIEAMLMAELGMPC
jgi:hypothetical protein